MTLHPQSDAFLSAVRAANAPAWYEMPIEQAQRTFSELPFFGEGPQVANVHDFDIDGVPVRMYRHHRTSASDVVVYFHGGGWVLGDVETHDALCRRITNAAQATVVSVDYRKPPMHRYPAAVDDGYRVCQRLVDDASSLGVSGRIVVAGDSAGGNLAAALSLKARDQNGPAIAGQVLIYPVLDATMSSDSYEQFSQGFGLTRATMAWFWKLYTGETEGRVRNDQLASPLAAEDLSGLPATHVLTAEYDVLRDEGVEMVRRLREAGVPTTHHQQLGMLHGFIHFAALFDDSIAATEEIGRRCRQIFDGD